MPAFTNATKASHQAANQRHEPTPPRTQAHRLPRHPEGGGHVDAHGAQPPRLGLAPQQEHAHGLRRLERRLAEVWTSGDVW